MFTEMLMNQKWLFYGTAAKENKKKYLVPVFLKVYT